MGEAVGVCAGFDDGGVVGEAVDDCCAQAGVGEGVGPGGEGLVGGDRDGVLLLSFGEDLEQQFGASPVEFQVAELVNHEEVDAAVAVDGLGELFLVGGFDELVHEPGGEGVSDAVALLGGGGAERDEQVGLAGAGAPDQAQRVAAADPVACGELVDGGRVDVGVRGEVEVGEPFLAGEAGALDATQGGAAVAVVDDGADRGQPKPAAGLVDRGLRGLLGEALTTAKALGTAGAGGGYGVPVGVWW